MLIVVLIVIITVGLLIGMDRVSGRQTTADRSRKAADDRFLYRFLHRQSHRRPQQSPDTRIPSQINHVKKCELRCTRVVRNVDSRPALIGESILIGLSVSRVNISSSLGERNPSL